MNPMPQRAPQPQPVPQPSRQPDPRGALRELAPSARTGTAVSKWGMARKALLLGLLGLGAFKIAPGILGRLSTASDTSNTAASAATESSAKSWIHHATASEREVPMTWVGRSGRPAAATAVALSADDVDHDLTERALKGESLPALNQAVQSAQPSGLIDDPEPAAPQPSITPGMRMELVTGDSKFYHIMLFDSCDEDGDVVDVIIDGHPFARVPITHAGATLSVPLNSGSTIEVVGVRDGVGGITVACSTSRGEGFVRVLREGERQLLSVVPGP